MTSGLKALNVPDNRSPFHATAQMVHSEVAGIGASERIKHYNCRLGPKVVSSTLIRAFVTNF